MPERRQDESAGRRSEEGNESTQTGGGTPVPEAQDVVRRSAEAAAEGAGVARAASAAVPRAVAQASPA